MDEISEEAIRRLTDEAGRISITGEAGRGDLARALIELGRLRKLLKHTRWWLAVAGVVILAIGGGVWTNSAARQRECRSRNESRAAARSIWSQQQARDVGQDTTFARFVNGLVPDPAKLSPEESTVYGIITASQAEQARQQAEQRALIERTYEPIACPLFG